MKSGTLLTVLAGLGAVGYFGYDWYQKREQEKKDKTETEARKKHDADLAAARANPTAANPNAEAEAEARRAARKAAEEAAAAQEPDPGAGSGTGKPMVVPDLVGMKPDAAAAALTAAGFSADNLKTSTDHTCPIYKDDKAEMLPVGTICSQQPLPGTEAMARSKVTIVLERDTYEAGAIGTAFEWKRMPDVDGMTLAQARKALADKGFTESDFVVEDAVCAKGRVCGTKPEPGKRKTKNPPGTIYIGQ